MRNRISIHLFSRSRQLRCERMNRHTNICRMNCNLPFQRNFGSTLTVDPAHTLFTPTPDKESCMNLPSQDMLNACPQFEVLHRKLTLSILDQDGAIKAECVPRSSVQVNSWNLRVLISSVSFGRVAILSTPFVHSHGAGNFNDSVA